MLLHRSQSSGQYYQTYYLDIKRIQTDNIEVNRVHKIIRRVGNSLKKELEPHATEGGESLNNYFCLINYEFILTL